MSTVNLHGKDFQPFITNDQILSAIDKVAEQITADLKNETPVILGVLNGSFVFMTDLVQRLNFNCEVSFVKLASYEGTQSTGVIRQLIGVNEDLKGRSVVVVEDIVDTGNTVEKLLEELEKIGPKEVKIATLLYKPEAFTKSYGLDYVAIEIPNDFVVGYGLDFDGLGRNLSDIYKIVE